MTTEASARLYEAQHMKDMEGRPIAVHNPHDKPFEELPVIYGFNNGGSAGWFHGLLMAEDGTLLGEHLCSSESYMTHDLGILEGTRPDRHEEFRKHYPDGYRMEFVGLLYVRIHEKLMAAIAIDNSKVQGGDLE
jgi:hypothetical protein